jgi:hypothetical protein
MTLLERLEAAERGSRKLDAEIARLRGVPPVDINLDRAPHYTTSLDAALSLVEPPAYLGSIIRAYSVNDPDTAWITVLVGPEGGGVPLGNWHDGRIEACGATPELSCCSAALRARASQKE